MSNDKADPSNKDSKISSADDPTKKGDVELNEEELKRVSGGTKYLEFKLKEVLINGTISSGSS